MKFTNQYIFSTVQGWFIRSLGVGDKPWILLREEGRNGTSCALDSRRRIRKFKTPEGAAKAREGLLK